jgi:hypothetical protein
MPDPGPLGETFFEASDRAIVAASLVKSPSGGNVDAVFTFETHRFERDADFEVFDPDADFDEERDFRVAVVLASIRISPKLRCPFCAHSLIRKDALT